MKHLLPFLLLALLLGSAPAWATTRPVAGIIVPPNTTQTIAPSPPDASGPDTHYAYLDVQHDGRAIIDQSVKVRNVFVRTGGTVQFSGIGELTAPITSFQTQPNIIINYEGSIRLEPGARIEVDVATGNGIPLNFYEAALQPAVDVNSNVYYTFYGSANSYNTGSNGNSLALPAQVGRLTNNASATVTLTNSTTVNQELHLTQGILTLPGGTTLTLASSAAGTALLDARTTPGNTGSINGSGTFAVQRYIDGSRNAGPGYRHLSAPISGQTVASFSTATFTPRVDAAYNTNPASVPAASFPTVFSYNQNRIGTSTAGAVGFDQGWLSPADTTDFLGLATGYSVNMPANATMTFSETPANVRIGPVARGGLLRGSNGEAGYHLLGNPLAAPLNWDEVTSDAGYSDLGTAVYVFKSSGPYAGTYTSYLPGTGGGIGTNGGTNVLPLGQGFFVRTSTVGAAGAITFNHSHLFASYDAAGTNGSTAGNSAGTVAVQRGSADLRPQLRLRLHSAATAQAHEAVVYFDGAATAGFDDAYDAAFLAGPGQTLALATAAAGTLCSINGQPALTGQDVLLPLHLSAPAGGATLAVDALTNLPAGYHAYLRDALTGQYTDLSTAPAVPLATATAGRFALLFTTQARALATAPAALAALVSLYPNPAHGTATLLLPASLRGRQATAVAIVNALGQVVRTASQPVAAETLALDLNGLAAGLYTVQAHTAAGTVSRRLVVE